MALANVNLIDTFDTWRIRTNQVIETLNKQTEGSFLTSGVITISNTSAVGLNVTTNSIRVKGNTFDANAITFVSNSSTIRINGGGGLGTTVYFDTGDLSVNLSDANTANIASAYTVNVVNRIATSGYRTTNVAFDVANAAFTYANSINPKLDVYNEASSGSTFYPLFSNVTTGNTKTLIIDTGDLSYIPGSGTLGVKNLSVAATITGVTINGTTGNITTVNATEISAANITSSGSVTAQNFNSVSDLSLKENVTPIVNALDVVKSMTGVGFDWKNTNQHTYGVIAQDIEKIVPELVADINNSKTVNYDGIIAFLIQAIKEMSEEIDQLKKNQ